MWLMKNTPYILSPFIGIPSDNLIRRNPFFSPFQERVSSQMNPLLNLIGIKPAHLPKKIIGKKERVQFKKRRR